MVNGIQGLTAQTAMPKRSGNREAEGRRNDSFQCPGARSPFAKGNETEPENVGANGGKGRKLGSIPGARMHECSRFCELTNVSGPGLVETRR